MILWILLITTTISITSADFVEIECGLIELTGDRGLNCDFNNIIVPELTHVNIIERNTSIESVSFRQSELYTLPQDVFAKFPSLKHIDVEMTQLKVIKADNFRGAGELKYFLGRFNGITKLESETFLLAPKLKFIVLQYNQISSIEAQAFKGLDLLEALYLDFNRVSILSESILHNLPNLLHFSMSNNNLTSITNDLFIKTTRLETLNLGHNLLTHFNDTNFDFIPNLERVQLDHNNLKKLDLVACKSTEINVNSNELETIELSKWTRTISAWDNPIRKFIIHEHYGAGRSYNFSFSEVNEIVFFVHEHCCTAENLENFELLTQSFGDLGAKNLHANKWICVFLKSIGYETQNGLVVNNVCTKMNGMQLSTTTTTTTENISTILTAVDDVTESSDNDASIETIFDGKNFTSDFEIANVEEILSTTETQAEKGIWKSIKSKASGLKNSVVQKWNYWVG